MLRIAEIICLFSYTGVTFFGATYVEAFLPDKGHLLAGFQLVKGMYAIKMCKGRSYQVSCTGISSASTAREASDSMRGLWQNIKCALETER